MCFFGWLLEKRPQGGPKKCWKDIIRKYLNDLNIPESCWYDLANKSRSAWKDHYHACLESSQVSSGNVDLQTVVCPECHRCFKRISDLKRPVWEIMVGHRTMSHQMCHLSDQILHQCWDMFGQTSIGTHI